MAVTSRLLGASGVVIVGVVAAALLGQLPAIGVEDHAIVATPSDPVQRLVCPGSPVAVGAAGQKASTLSADPAPSRRVGVDGAGSVTTATLGGGNVRGAASTRPHLFTAPAADAKHGTIAGAESQVVSTGDASGFTATACSRPVNIAWVAAGSTTTGRTSVLTLANASNVPAQVELDLWTEAGPVSSTGPDQLTVGPHSRLAVSLASIAPGAAGTAVRVVSTGGQLGVALEQRVVRGLESGGLDLTGPTAAPATHQVVTGVRIANAAAVAAASADSGYGDLMPVLRLLAPGGGAADVRVTITGTAGSGHRVLTRTLPGGKVTDLTLPGLTDGVYSLDITSSRPLIAGARVATITDPTASTTDTGVYGGPGGATTATGRGIDLAWLAAADPLGTTTPVAVADGPGASLAFANPGPHPVTVRVSGVAGASLAVPAGGTASLPVRPGIGAVTGAAGLRAAVSYAGAAAVAGYPVEPADQAAHPVRVTH